VGSVDNRERGRPLEEAWRRIRPMFPFGRFGEPDDAARLVVWLTTEEAD
jgi:3-oxoacyl-[acyl-carrier protein] reductase